MTIRNTSMALIAAALLVVPAFAAQESAKLRLAVKEGDVYEFTSKTENKISIGGAMEQDLTQKGTATYTISFGKSTDGWTSASLGNMKVTNEGEALPGADPAEIAAAAAKVNITMAVNARGEVKDVKSSTDDPMAMAAAAPITSAYKVMGVWGIIFPEKELKSGETWETTVDMGEIMEASTAGQITAKGAKLPVKYTYVGMETVEGTKVHKFTYTMAGSFEVENPMAGPGKAKSDTKGTIWLAADTGVMFRTETSGKQEIDLGVVQVTVNTTTVATSKKK